MDIIIMLCFPCKLLNNTICIHLGCMETETDTQKRNVSKRRNVIFDFFCFGNALQTSINTHTYIYM